MNCPHCPKNASGEAVVLRITHTFATPNGYRTQRSVCNTCGRVYNLATILLETDGWGSGADCLAKQLQNGKKHISVEKGPVPLERNRP